MRCPSRVFLFVSPLRIPLLVIWGTLFMYRSLHFFFLVQWHFQLIKFIHNVSLISQFRVYGFYLLNILSIWILSVVALYVREYFVLAPIFTGLFLSIVFAPKILAFVSTARYVNVYIIYLSFYPLYHFMHQTTKIYVYFMSLWFLSQPVTLI